VKIVHEGVIVLWSEVSVDATNREIHLGQAPRGWIGLLAVYRDSSATSTMCLDKSLGLHKHAARAAARVKDATLKRHQHLDQNAYYVARSVKLPALLALRASELSEEVFVYATEEVFTATLAVS